MRRIHELEAWSIPGSLLAPDYGKDLAQELWSLGVSREVFLGLSEIPDETDVENLRLAIASGEFKASDFLDFCDTHSLPLALDSVESACRFLEYKLGRRLGWIHLPEGSDPQMILSLVALLRERGHVVIDPENESCE